MSDKQSVELKPVGTSLQPTSSTPQDPDQSFASESSSDPLLHGTSNANTSDIMVNIQDNPRNTAEGEPHGDKDGPTRLNYPCGRPKETRIELNSKWKELIKDEKEIEHQLSAGVSARDKKGKVEEIFTMKEPNPEDPKNPKVVPCTDYGKVEFIDHTGSTKKTSRYIRVSNDTKPDALLDLFQNNWNIPDPNIIISVTGGALDFQLDRELSVQFKKGLVKTASDTGAWIVTGGTNAGVMSYVGTAVAEQPQKIQKKITLIGVATWGIIYNREHLKYTKEAEAKGEPPGMKKSYRMPAPGEPKIALNPDHTHFILVDNGTEGKFGVEIALRANFESYVLEEVGKQNVAEIDEEDGRETIEKSGRNTTHGSKNSLNNKGVKGCQAVCILLEGGPNSAKTVFESLRNRVPCVIAAKSGRASDIIAYAKENCKYKRIEGKKEKEAYFDEETESRLNSMMLTLYNWNGKPDDFKKKNLDEQKDFLLSICAESNKKFVTIFDISAPGSNDLDKAILRALMKSMQASDDPSTRELKLQLFFSVKWNRPDSALEHIFAKNRNKFEQSYLQEVFIECMLENKFEFVRLLLEHGVAMEMFKNVACLEQIFIFKNNTNEKTFYQFMDSIVMSKYSKKPFFLAMLAGITHLIGGGFRFEIMTDEFVDEYTRYYNERVKKESEVGRQLTPEEVEELNPPQVSDPTFILFLWAIVNHYHEMSRIFWRHGDNYMAKALIGMRMYTIMGEQFSNMDQEELQEHINDYSELAMDILRRSYKANENDSSQMIVSSLSCCSTHSVLGLAVLAEHEEFIAHSSSQTVLNEIWSGGIRQCDNINLKVLLALFVPPLALSFFDFDVLGNIFAKSEERIGDKDHAIKQTAMNYVGSDEEEMSAKKKSVCEKFGLFYSAPVSKFWFTTLLFCVFLLIYTYFVLGELPADQIPWIEIVLACFVVSITTEEIRQVLTESGSFEKKMSGYFTSIWNWMDVFGVVLFWIAFAMRLIHDKHCGCSFLELEERSCSQMTSDQISNRWAQGYCRATSCDEVHRFIPNNDWKDIARMFYILDIFFWYMRLLNIFTINKRLGPLITIILTMIPELLRFFFIWILFMIAFGVITKSVATPIRYGQVTALDMIKVVDMSYWQTYGELFLEDLDDDAAMKPGTDCTNDYTDDTGLPPCPFLPHTSVVFTAIYMVVGNILLMNLLIALFTSIYEQVNEKSTTDWKNKRLDVIVEYHTRPPFPPPFTILYHLILLFRWPSHKEDVKKSKGLTLDVSTNRMYELLLFEEEVKEEYMMDQFSKEGIDINKQVATLTKNFEKNEKLMKENMAHLANESAKTNKKLDEIEQLLRTLIEKQQ